MRLSVARTNLEGSERAADITSDDIVCSALNIILRWRVLQRFSFYGTGLYKPVSMAGKYQRKRALVVAARSEAAVLAIASRTEMAGGTGADKTASAFRPSTRFPRPRERGKTTKSSFAALAPR